MDKNTDQSLQKIVSGDDTVSLTDLLRPLWRGRKTILVGTALAMLVGIAGAIYLQNYNSEGFLQFGGAIPMPKEKEPLSKEKDLSPGIVLSDYKRYAAVFSTNERLDEFVKKNKLEGATSADFLYKAFASRDGISKLVAPVYPFTKLDAKDLMEQPKDASNNVIGLRINFEAPHPVDAQRMVELLGLYAMDSIIYLSYSDSLRFKHSEITAKITRFDNDIIDLKEKLAEYQRRGATLKQIVGRYPDSASQAARQVISVTPDNARYLSPITHLMSSEVEATQATEDIIKAQREQQQAILLRDYYDAAKLVLDSEKSGNAILRALEPLKEKIFKDKNLKDDLVKEVYNTISIDNQNAISLYLEKSRFIAGPNLPTRPTTKLSVAILASFLIGLILSSMLVIVRNWWSENRLLMSE